jgi:hypothetical protein
MGNMVMLSTMVDRGAIMSGDGMGRAWDLSILPWELL